MRSHLSIALLSIGLLAAKVGCSTQDEILYGDPARVAGGTTASSGSTSTTTSGAGGAGGTGGGGQGGACTVDDACSVHFAADILQPIIVTTSDCANANCHAKGTKNLLLDPAGTATDAWAALTGYQLDGDDGGAYVVPCYPQASKMLCNLAVDADAGVNPYGECGTLMPFLGVGQKLSLDQLETIATWITCGAPNN